MRSTIIFPGSRVSDFAVNSRARKLNKSQTKKPNIKGVQYLSRIYSFSRINRSGVNFVLSFILSSFYFLIICAKSPFRLRLRQSTLSPLSIVCLLIRVLSYHPSIQKLMMLHWYDVPIQLPPADSVLVKIFIDSEKIRCLWQEFRLPAPLLL